LTPGSSRLLLKAASRSTVARLNGRGVPDGIGHLAKIGDIKGRSLDSKHKDEIEVLSFSWGLTNGANIGAGGGAGAGKATFQDLTIVHTIDKASPC
jgi:hypothetical protein